ncbi:LysR family transcriptional regulator [Thalassospira tepidiphila]|jgi:DNA-binding transcriptional LysR family regulator|uniref:LysR family transcriptional regulator n=1 Tax=Thalassospira tepidiphila TaxID=393657 RepID=UPI001BCBCA9A|nr:LysR family transcriptional regulator [Thalassospira tepidiphila]MBS8273930.1 LysR family transcriptional regulator [Thalassospira tepidiphila]
MTDISKLDLNLLVTLDTLLVERNVTHAARRLNLSQPAISTRLTRLRDLLGDPLLLPAQRGMIPTERALELQEPLHNALEGVRRVVAENSPFDPSTITATIAIAASDYVQYAILMPLLDVLRRDAPGIKVAWRTIDTSMLDSQMARGDVSLALSTPETAPETLRMRKIYREEYVAIARCDHPAIGRSLDLDSFCALEHVIVSPEGGGFEGPADDALAALGRKRNVALSAPGFLVVPEIVARSDMIALVPSRVAQGRTGQIRMFDPPMPVTGFDMALIWHDRTTTHPLHRWLRDRITALIANASTD